MEVAKEIIPELNRRFPNVPRILVATKDDLKNDLSCIRSVTNELEDTSINNKSESGAARLSENSSVGSAFNKEMGKSSKYSKFFLVVLYRLNELIESKLTKIY